MPKRVSTGLILNVTFLDGLLSVRKVGTSIKVWSITGDVSSLVSVVYLLGVYYVLFLFDSSRENHIVVLER
jgi:hypothetical protein